MVALDDFFGGYTLLVGADGDGSAVGIAAGDHQHFVTLHAVIAGKDVGRQVAASNMPQMKRAVGVGPSNGDEDTLRQGMIPK